MFYARLQKDFPDLSNPVFELLQAYLRAGNIDYGDDERRGVDGDAVRESALHEKERRGERARAGAESRFEKFVRGVNLERVIKRHRR